MLNTLCGSVINLSGFKNIGGVVSVTCKVYITDFTILHLEFLHFNFPYTIFISVFY